MDAIVVQDLHKFYGQTRAVDGLNFNVRQGEIFGLLGPNGAGKTTAVECIQGLRKPDIGVIRVLGLDPGAEPRAVRRRIGCQLQESALPDRIKVWEALELFATFVPGRSDWEGLLEQWGLVEKRDAAFVNLSGGQRQRLLVALALVNNPEIVFFDEMTTGLDPAARRVAWDLIRAIQDQGTTVVLVTHFMEEAEALCERVAVVDRGQIVALDTPQGLIATHANEIRVKFSAHRQTDLSWLDDVPHVDYVNRRNGRVEVVGDGPVLAMVAAALVNRGLAPRDLRVEQPTLEDVFLRITGRTMLDEVQK